MPNKRPHLVIDGCEANVSSRVGSNVYAFEVIRQLAEIARKHIELTVTVVLPTPPIADLPKETKRWHYQVVTPERFWTQWALPLHIWRNRHTYDVLFTPGHYAPRFCAIPYVSSVMDTAYLEYPEQFKRSDLAKLKHWTAYSVQRATKIIAISEHTKQSVIQQYGKPAGDVAVAYPAANLVTPAPKSALSQLGITAPYFLYVGTVQPRKNIVRLVEAYEHYCKLFTKARLTPEQRKSIRRAQLVLAGKTGWLAEPIMQRIAKSPEREDILLTGFTDEATKARLYKDATASVLVGLYEGFGIPPLESLGYGTIPIVSNTTSLPEVVGNAGLQVDPLNPKEIAQALFDVQFLSSKRKAVYRRRGREQFNRFSWSETGKIIWQVIEQELRKPR